ncbi:unnamed protein product [Trichogramma brassicae]|uniref:Uncharacterized protein n=1 Tax=Trichogramma brassicae TaxID=86971 RepID=A0A6H5I8M1_9HYME|nr:unnamed protein product [Trichogramma brassicae]
MSMRGRSDTNENRKASMKARVSEKYESFTVGPVKAQAIKRLSFASRAVCVYIIECARVSYKHEVVQEYLRRAAGFWHSKNGLKKKRNIHFDGTHGYRLVLNCARRISVCFGDFRAERQGRTCSFLSRRLACMQLVTSLEYILNTVCIRSPVKSSCSILLNFSAHYSVETLSRPLVPTLESRDKPNRLSLHDVSFVASSADTGVNHLSLAYESFVALSTGTRVAKPAQSIELSYSTWSSTLV